MTASLAYISGLGMNGSVRIVVESLKKRIGEDYSALMSGIPGDIMSLASMSGIVMLYVLDVITNWLKVQVWPMSLLEIRLHGMGLPTWCESFQKGTILRSKATR